MSRFAFKGTTKLYLKIKSATKIYKIATNIELQIDLQIQHRSTDSKLILLFINSIYLVFSFLNMQRRLLQTKVYHKFVYFVWKETTSRLQTFKVATAKNFLLRCVCTKTCFNVFYFMWYLEDQGLKIRVRGVRMYAWATGAYTWLASCVRGQVSTFPFRLDCKTSKYDLS